MSWGLLYCVSLQARQKHGQEPGNLLVCLITIMMTYDPVMSMGDERLFLA